MLGFVVAVTLMLLATLSTINALCKDYSDLTQSMLVNGDDVPSIPVCLSSDTTLTATRIDAMSQYEISYPRRRWRDKMTFLFSLSSKKSTEVNSAANRGFDDVIIAPTQHFEMRMCLCHLIWKYDGHIRRVVEKKIGRAHV